MKVKLAGIGLCIVATSALLTATTLYAYEETEIQRNACKPDVYRICKWYSPSRNAITYCLMKNLDKLSPACRAVMEGKLR